MSNSVTRRSVTRWAVPAAAITAVVGGAVSVPLIAGADSELPDRTAAELLVGLATAEPVPFAGTVVQSADLGLPAIPGLGTGEAGSLADTAFSLLDGSTTARIWYADGDTYRFALQDELAETDLVRNGTDVWCWNSEDEAAVHLTVPESDGEGGSLFGGLLGGFGGLEPGQHGSDGEGEGNPFGGDGNPFGGEGSMTLPPAAAELALQMIAPSTQVDVDGTATVAGRAAYELVVRPRDEQSLIGSIRLAVDGEHSLPLRVQIFPRDGGDPALEVGFTSISFDEPDSSTFEFTPPPGTEVEELDEADLKAEHEALGKGEHGLPEHSPESAPDGVNVVGSGWTSVAVVRGVDIEAISAELEADDAAALESFLAEFEDVSGPYGEGRALSSALVSALLLDDGRLLIGAVPLDVLEEAAMTPEAAG